MFSPFKFVSHQGVEDGIASISKNIESLLRRLKLGINLHIMFYISNKLISIALNH
jgi:phage-related holin